MNSFLYDPMAFLYPDTLHDLRGNTSFHCDVPRGGIASVNLVITRLDSTEPLHINRLNPTRRKSELFRLHDVLVQQNSGPNGFCERDDAPNPHKARQAPFRVFDAMESVSFGPQKRIAANHAVFQIQIPVPRSAKTGDFTVRFRVSAGNVMKTLSLSYTVHRACLPETGKDSWFYTNWFSVENMASRHNLKLWSRAHWNMIHRYAVLMAKGRQNTFWLPLRWYMEYKNGNLLFHAERFRKLIKIFTDAGLYFIEGGHFATRPDNEWNAPEFCTVLGRHPVSSMAANREIASIADALLREITENDWLDRYIQHAADEPIAVNTPSYRILVGIIRKYMPGIPILDALSEPEIAGSVDIWCPQIHHYEARRDDFETTRLQGDSIWCYTCCFPCGNYLNRLLDFELVRCVLIGWGCAAYGLNGFLHWGLNHYKSDQNPFEDNAPDHGNGHCLPPGDTHVVYPGPDGPWSSVRFEAHRVGIEDLELLQLLKKKDPARFQTLVRSLFRSFSDYAKDLAKLRTARKKLLQLTSRI